VSEWASEAYSELNNSYRYDYDGIAGNIFDGGYDMYDDGNQVQIYA